MCNIHKEETNYTITTTTTPVAATAAASVTITNNRTKLQRNSYQNTIKPNQMEQSLKQEVKKRI